MTHPSDEILSALLEHDLPAGERQRVERHAAGCERCGQQLRRLAAVVAAAAAAPAAWPGKAAAWEALAARLPAGSAQPRRLAWRTALGRRAALAGALAAAVVAVLLVIPRNGAPADSPLAALVESDRQMSRELDNMIARAGWGSPTVRQVVAAANRELDAGARMLRRALRDRPADPALWELARRALERRESLLQEVAR